MQIEIQIDGSCREPQLVIRTDRMTDEIEALVKRLSQDTPQMLAGFRDDAIELLDPAELIRIYAAAGKVFAVTAYGEYALRLRLYELEDRLDSQWFVRISNSELIHLRKVKGFDLSLAGTICVRLTNGDTTYVSRRYVSKIKKGLGI